MTVRDDTTACDHVVTVDSGTELIRVSLDGVIERAPLGSFGFFITIKVWGSSEGAIECGEPFDASTIQFPGATADSTPQTSFVGLAPARRGEPLQTDELEYLAAKGAQLGAGFEWAFQLVTEYTNPTSDSLFLDNCNPDGTRPVFGVLASSGDVDTESAFDPVWACGGHDQQLAIAPGETRTDTLEMMGPPGLRCDHFRS